MTDRGLPVTLPPSILLFFHITTQGTYLFPFIYICGYISIYECVQGWTVCVTHTYIYTYITYTVKTFSKQFWTKRKHHRCKKQFHVFADTSQCLTYCTIKKNCQQIYESGHNQRYRHTVIDDSVHLLIIFCFVEGMSSLKSRFIYICQNLLTKF